MQEPGEALSDATRELARLSDVRAAKVDAVIESALTALGYDIVRVIVSGDRRPRLQIMVEPSDGRGMGVDDCAAVSRTVGAILDVEEPISGSYLLEVSSPGLDRPLTRPQDFVRFVGFEAKLETREAIGGCRRFRGRLMGVEQSLVLLAANQGEIRVAIDGILRAKLVLTDDLIAAGQAGRSAVGGEQKGA